MLTSCRCWMKSYGRSHHCCCRLQSRYFRLPRVSCSLKECMTGRNFWKEKKTALNRCSGFRRKRKTKAGWPGYRYCFLNFCYTLKWNGMYWMYSLYLQDGYMLSLRPDCFFPNWLKALRYPEYYRFGGLPDAAGYNWVYSDPGCYRMLWWPDGYNW